MRARSHGLPSPQGSGPGAGLTKWFFHPGFTPDTGGLLREPGLLEEREAFERDAWLRAMGWPRGHGEHVSVLFSYAHAGIGAWLAALAAQPTLLLVPQGPAQDLVRRALGPSLRLNALRALLLDWLPQKQFDHLLWCADLNVVRGEDSAGARVVGRRTVHLAAVSTTRRRAPTQAAGLSRTLAG